MIQDFAKQIFGYERTDDRQEIGIGGFTADVRITESIQMTSDVPDNYVEDGSVINDHVINNPIVISIDGEVADIHEKVEFVPPILLEAIDKAADIIESTYIGQKTLQMIQKIEKIAEPITKAYDALNDALDKGQQVYDFFSGQKAKTRQDDFFDFLNQIYYSKQLIDIHMPFRTYKNMRITSLTIVKDNTTSQALKYKLQAKEVRFAKTILVDSRKYFQKAPSGSVKGKVSDKQNKGVTEGEEKKFSTPEKKKSFLGTILS